MIDVAHDRNHGGTRYRFRAFFTALDGFSRIFRGLFFEGDDFRVRSEEARHFAGQFGIERLIDGRENAAHHQARNYVLGANAQLLGQVFHRDTFCNGDIPRDRRGFIADGHPRGGSIALHRAFFHASRYISLPWSS